MPTHLVTILLGLGLALVGIAVLVSKPATRAVLAGIGLGLGAVVAIVELFTKLGG